MLAWSPIDNHLAFRFTSRQTKQVGVVDVASGAIVWQTNDSASSRSPLWVGQDKLLFERYSNYAKQRELVVVEPSTKIVTTLFKESDANEGVFLRGDPELSPDGSSTRCELISTAYAAG
jgi:hypothetical protein